MTPPFAMTLSYHNISTHILTKRMTAKEAGELVIEGNFNSHPHEEDDGRHYERRKRICYFNSHPHEEDDHENQIYLSMTDISTHILTKRMTVMLGFMLMQAIHFNSHPHEEDDYSSI